MQAKSFVARATLLVVVGLAGWSAYAAATPASQDIQARYVRERAVCMSGQSSQSQATCLREAAAARQAARSGALDSGTDDQLRLNSVNRCNGLKSPFQDECLRRMRSEGTWSGSVSGGGILRELVSPDTSR